MTFKAPGVGISQPNQGLLTLGVEEEYLVVDPVTRAVVPDGPEIVRRAASDLGENIGTETTQFQVEAKTPPCTDLGELHRAICRMRAIVVSAAASMDLRIVASGTPVLGNVVPPPICDHPRYQRGFQIYRALNDEQSICACHIHVGIADREQALCVSNHLRPHLPLLIAATANSPFWMGRDTGYASWRTVACSRWPVAGPPPYFTSLAHYECLVSTLLDNGILLDRASIYWDIRPSHHLPTLEVRAADVQMHVEETVALAALVRALVMAALARTDRSEPVPQPSAELLRAAYWAAARYGIDGSGIDVHTGRPTPAVELVQRLVEHAYPVSDQSGDLEVVTAWLHGIITNGTGAARQRTAFVRSSSLAGVVDHLVAQTDPTKIPQQHLSYCNKAVKIEP
jgi:carboxylate-amine ligase